MWMDSLQNRAHTFISYPNLDPTKPIVFKFEIKHQLLLRSKNSDSPMNGSIWGVPKMVVPNNYWFSY